MTRYLLDTNIFIFSVFDRDMLSRDVKYILGDCRNKIYMSAINVYEMINLQQSGSFVAPHKKHSLIKGVADFIKNETDFEIKPICHEHLHTLDKLPMLPDHKDPVDRMVIAHAITEDIHLISSDRQFPRYTKYGLKLVFNPK